MKFRSRIRKALMGLSLLITSQVFAQSNFIPLNDVQYQMLERYEIFTGRTWDNLHFSALPLQRKDVIAFTDSIDQLRLKMRKTDGKNFDYIKTDNDEWSNCDFAMSKAAFLKYFYLDKASLYQHRREDFMVKINPVFDFELGTESASGEKLFTNTRGLEVRGWIASKVGYYFLVNENQSRYPLYVRERIDSFGAVPNEGYYKNFKTDAVDFFTARGSFTVTAAKFITIQFGHDKNFIGNGIRSLALSDFSEDYLFLKLQTQVWKISYQNLFMDLTDDFQRGSDQLLPKKYAALHHLSLNAMKFLNVGAWESVVFARQNDFEFQYLNPIIFYRSVEQLIGSPDNTMLGIDYRLLFLHHFSFYGQIALDDYNFGASKGEHGYWGNKFGIQNGVKYVNAFTLNNLDLQLEWNLVRPYTYTHNDSVANFTNYNQPLAHPLGANFSEWIGVIRCQPIFPLNISARITYAKSGADTSGSNWGANIFIPSYETTIEQVYGNKIAQGVVVNLFMTEVVVSYMIKHNLFADLVFVHRKTDSALAQFQSASNAFSIAVRMNIARKNLEF